MKNYNYMLTIILYPFMSLLGILLLNNYIKNNINIYLFLLLSMIVVFIPSFIMSLYNSLDEILNSERKWRIVLLIFFSVFYLPIYYTNNISKERLLGIVILIIDLIASFFLYNIVNNKLYDLFYSLYKNDIVIKEEFLYTSTNNLFTINVDKNYRCNRDMGEYVVACDNYFDDSFIGIYSYEIDGFNDDEINDLLMFHLNQTIDYIRENGYEEQIENIDNLIEINYNDMVVLLLQNNYIVNDNQYSLVFIKELKKENVNIDEFQKMVESIKFLSYNEEVSS